MLQLIDGVTTISLQFSVQLCQAQVLVGTVHLAVGGLGYAAAVQVWSGVAARFCKNHVSWYLEA